MRFFLCLTLCGAFSLPVLADNNHRVIQVRDQYGRVQRVVVDQHNRLQRVIVDNGGHQQRVQVQRIVVPQRFTQDLRIQRIQRRASAVSGFPGQVIEVQELRGGPIRRGFQRLFGLRTSRFLVGRRGQLILLDD